MLKTLFKWIFGGVVVAGFSLCAAEFKAAENTMDFGSKKLIVKPNGTFRIFSDGRLLLDFCFCTGTPYSPYSIGNSSCKDIKKYDGGAFCVTSFEANSATKSFITKGMVPYHKKGEPVNAREWKQVIKMLPDNKIDYTLVLPIPDGYTWRQGTRTTFLTMPNAEGYSFDYGYTQMFSEKQKTTNVGKVITVKTLNPDDVFKIHILCDNMFFGNYGPQKQLRIGLHPSKSFLNVHFVFDLMKCKEAAPHSEGGVDFVKVDNLHLTTTGKNMLPNPYFAQGLLFINDNAGVEAVLGTDGGKFGKYYMKPDTSKQLDLVQKHGAGWYLLPAVPGDKGTYTFSFYAKGNATVTVVVKGQAVNWNWATIPTKSFRVNSKDWQRKSFTFTKNEDGAISIWLRFTNIKNSDIPCVDGLQLEKGDKATDFSAEKVSARLITNPPDYFFESGKPMSAKLELSTLEPAVKGTGKAVIRDYFGKTVFTHHFKFDFKNGQYPIVELPINGKLPDGVFVLEVTYDAGKKNTEYFRFSVMPWMNGRKRATANLFCVGYQGGYKNVWANNKHERWLQRLVQVGCASLADARKIEQNDVNLYKKHGVYTGGGMGFMSRKPANIIRQIAPNTPVTPSDELQYFYVHDPDGGLYSNIKALMVDYRLMGGWTPEYRKQFVDTIAKLVRRFQEAPSYCMGSEWYQSIKDDPHYIDLYIAFREAVKSVYPNAKVFERGCCDMEPMSGTAFVEKFLVRAKKQGAVTDYAATHTYVRPVTRLYGNFRTFVNMVNRTGGKDMKMTFPEGGQYYAYCIPQWNVPLVGWFSGDGNMWGSGAISYDMGNAEKLSTAYYARFYLIFLTEFARVDQACSGCSHCCFLLDSMLAPRGPQKSINTLCGLFANPKRYLGDYTFAPESKCFIWEDETGCPLAAVWNEESAVELGFKKAPLTTINYRGAEYINIMGNKFTPENDGVFELTAAPVYIRGKKGDFKNFIAAMSGASVNDATKLPCRMSFELKDKNTLEMTISNMLGKKSVGTFKIFSRTSNLDIPASGKQTLKIQLPKALQTGTMNKLAYPYECTINGITSKANLDISCFMIPKFKGDWNKVPSITLTNKCGKNRDFSEANLSASYQMAWTKDKMLLRVKVKDDIFKPGQKAEYRWQYDAVQVYFDTRCSAIKTGKKSYDDDDYEFGLMPTADGKRCEVWRSIQPTIQLTLGIAAPPSHAMAPEIKAKFTRTKDGYLYEAEFPAQYLLPIRFQPGYNFAFGMYVPDRDKDGVYCGDKGVSLSTKPGTGCYNSPIYWPIAILTE